MRKFSFPIWLTVLAVTITLTSCDNENNALKECRKKFDVAYSESAKTAGLKKDFNYVKKEYCTHKHYEKAFQELGSNPSAKDVGVRIFTDALNKMDAENREDDALKDCRNGFNVAYAKGETDLSDKKSFNLLSRNFCNHDNYAIVARELGANASANDIGDRMVETMTLQIQGDSLDRLMQQEGS